MEWNWNHVLCPILISLVSLLWRLWRRKSNCNSAYKLPPGPRGWPIIGNIFDLGTLPHRSLAALKEKHGPLVWLSIGSVNVIVVQSAVAAEELFRNHDLSLFDRTIIDTMRSHDVYKSAMSLSSYNIYWRTLRRICTIELFTTKRINETMLLRQNCIDDMLLWIETEVKNCENTAITVTHFVFPALFNMIGNLMLSRNLVDPHMEIASEFYTALSGFAECLGRPNISDLFPSVRWLDLQGLRKSMDCHLGKMIEIMSGFVEERVRHRQQNGKEAPEETRKDFLDVLLDFEGTGKDEIDKLSHHQITIFLQELFFAGSETISTTVEWAMCELLQNSKAVVEIKAELGRVVGANKKLKETDIDNLHYLRATVKETLRMHPPAPLLFPRKAIHDISNLMGYNIPKGTQVWINAWAIGMDEECWEDALSFKPERFLVSNIGYRGHNFEFIPFGAGRRICAGLPLAHCVMPLILGSLLHHFDWELCENLNSETRMDMRETMGATARKLQPLKVVPRRSVHIY